MSFIDIINPSIRSFSRSGTQTTRFLSSSHLPAGQKNLPSTHTRGGQALSDHAVNVSSPSGPARAACPGGLPGRSTAKTGAQRRPERSEDPGRGGRARLALWPLLIFTLFLHSCDLAELFENASVGGEGLTEEEVVLGLRSALKIGSDNASDTCGAVGGYLQNALIAIALPDDVAEVLDYADNLNTVIQEDPVLLTVLELSGDLFPFEDFLTMRDKLYKAINRAAEKAAPLAKDIFWDALADMTIEDGMDILFGGDTTAATAYFKRETLSDLTNAFAPVVDNALSKVNAKQLFDDFKGDYNDLAAFYNANASLREAFDLQTLPRLTTDLAPYATERALSGLFVMLGLEEAKIRTDPLARVTEILEKVFGSLD